MMKWLKNLFGGSESSTTSEPAAAPTPSAPPSTPPQPPADAAMGEDVTSEPAGDPPA